MLGVEEEGGEGGVVVGGGGGGGGVGLKINIYAIKQYFLT